MDTTSANAMRMRPRYEWRSKGSPEDFIARLEQLVSFDPAVDMQCRARHAVLSIPVEARHTWSPILDLQVREEGEVTCVCARLGPEPHVWTGMIFLYAASGFPAFFGTMFGVAQWAMGETPWGLVALPIAVVVWASVYLSSFVGKGMGAVQIHQLLAVVEANLAVDAEEVEPAA